MTLATRFFEPVEAASGCWRSQFMSVAASFDFHRANGHISIDQHVKDWRERMRFVRRWSIASTACAMALLRKLA
jgi:hypothetical protein